MGEITFASEIQPSIDWTNPDTEGLLTCQYDDGVTVTNLLTGSTDNVFTIDNLIGVSSDGGERVSATWISKPIGIDDNPFSLLQTQEDVSREHGLVFDGDLRYVELGATEDDITSCDIEVKFTLTGSTTRQSIFHHENRGQITYQSGNIKVTCKIGGTWRYLYYAADPTGVYTARFTYDGTTIRLFVNGVERDSAVHIGTLNNDSYTAKIGIHVNGTSYRMLGTVHYLRMNIGSTFSRYWDLNQTTGDTITDKINGAVANLIGFPAESGYVRDDMGDITGYQYNTNTRSISDTIPCVGDFSVGIEFTPISNTGDTAIYGNTTHSGINGFSIFLDSNLKCRLYMKGSRTINTMSHVFTAGVRAKLEIIRVGSTVTAIINDIPYGTTGNAPVDTHQPNIRGVNAITNYRKGVFIVHSSYVDNGISRSEYDYKTLDDNKIIDILGNVHAPLTYIDTVGFRPIVPVEVFTVGNGKDYNDPQSLKDAQKNNPEIVRGVLYEMFDSSTFTYGYFWASGWPETHEMVAAKGHEYKGDANAANRVGFQGTTSTDKCFGSGGGTFKGLVMGRVEVNKNSRFDRTHVETLIGQSSKSHTLRDSYIKFTGSLFQSGTFNATNCILDSKFGDNDNSSALFATNCLILDSAYGVTANEYHAVNCKFVGTNQYLDTDIDNEFGIDFTGAFSDPAGKNYQINQEWKVNLIGEGWNGSSICDEFYITETPPMTVSVSFDDAIIIINDNLMSLRVDTSVDYDNTIITTSLEDMQIQRLSQVSYDDSIVNSSIGPLVLHRYTNLTYSDSYSDSSIQGMSLSRKSSLEFEDGVIDSNIDNMDISRNTIHNSLDFDDSVVQVTSIDMDVSRKSSLEFEDGLISVDIYEMDIDRKVSLQFDNTVISSTIEIMDIVLQLDNTLKLTFEDTVVQLTVGDMDLSRGTNLQFDNTVSNVLIEDMSIDRYCSLQLEDTIINSSIEDIVLYDVYFHYNLNFSESFVDLNIGDMDINRKTSIFLNDAIVETDTQKMQLKRHTSLQFENSSISTSLNDMEIKRVASLLFDDCVLQITGETVELTRYASLKYSDLMITSTLDNMYLVTEKLPKFNNLLLNSKKGDIRSLANKKILKKLTKITKQFGVKKNG